MGVGQSREAPPAYSPGIAAMISEKQATHDAYNEEVRNEDFRSILSRKYDIQAASSGVVDRSPLSTKNILFWQKNVLSQPKNRLTMAALSNDKDLSLLVMNPTRHAEMVTNEFSYKIDLEGSPVTNQLSSGRCWLFASTNVFRVQIQKRFNISEFQLSQAHLYFYDQLEKANFFLQNAIDTADMPLDSQLVQTLFKEPVSDGGQWDMVVNLVEKYGLVPHTLYPDSAQAKATSQVDHFVLNKLREYGLKLRDLVKEAHVHAHAAGEASISTEDISKALNVAKERYVKEIHAILVMALGTPIGPNEKFTWEYSDQNKKYHRVQATPLEFYRNYVQVDATQYFSLIHDPRNAFNKLYTVDRLGNIVGGKGIEYVNADIDILKQAAIRSIQNSEPVFFGSDVGQYLDRSAGVMDTLSFDYDLAFNTKLGMNKAQRLRTGASQMTHAMVLTGVNIVDGKPTRWRVENSWGSDTGMKGYYVMSDEWFNEYVYQVVTHPKYVDKSFSDIWNGKKYTTLPRWDPLGALA